MHKYLLTGAALLLLSSTAQALPLPGRNTVETQCFGFYDAQFDPIKEPGVYPSAHMHTHYGILADQTFNAKAYGDTAQLHARGSIPTVQNIPGGGPAPYNDPGYEPLNSTCTLYGDWAWYAIPSPRLDGIAYDAWRNWSWNNLATNPRVVSILRNTYSSPKGVDIYEPPFGMTFIVGNAHAMSEDEQDNEHVYWTCGDLVTKSRKPRDCSGMAPPPVNPYPALIADYKIKATAAATQEVVLETAIATGNHANIVAAAQQLGAKVMAMQAAALALESANPMPKPGTPVLPVSVPEPVEWGYSPRVTAVLMFPDCWDGANGYPNFDVQMGIDRRHFYYSTNGSCGNGIMITQLHMQIHFMDVKTQKPLLNPLNPDGSMRLTFASGPYYTMHADFGNTWSVGLGGLTAGCLNRQHYYGGYARLDTWLPDPCNDGAVVIPFCPNKTPAPPFGSEGVYSCRDPSDTPLH
jgi:Domain of unknown function (DUF1996)